MLMKPLVVLITLADDFLTFYNMFINNYSCNNTKLFRPWDSSGASQDSTVSTTNTEEGMESGEGAKKYLESREIFPTENSRNFSLDSPGKRINSVSEITNKTKSESKIQMKSNVKINHLYPASSSNYPETRTNSASEKVNKSEEEVMSVIKTEPKSPHEPSNYHQGLYQTQYFHPADSPCDSTKKRTNSVSEKINKTKNSFKSNSKSKNQAVQPMKYSHPAYDSKQVAQTKPDATKSFMPVKPEQLKSPQVYPMEYEYFHPAYSGDFYQSNLTSNLLPSGDAALVETLSQGIALEEYMRVLSQEQHEKMLAAKKQRPKKYKCPHCDVGFSNNGQLKGHIRIHTGERPFKCDEKECGKTFTRNEELTRHKRIHSGLRPFPCTHCGKRFGRKDHLKKHSRTHFQSRGMYAVPVMLPVEAWAASASSYPFIPMFGF